MKSRRQAGLLEKGDRFEFSPKGVFEVVESEKKENGQVVVSLQLKPVPCGPECGTKCDCHFSLFSGVDGTLTLTLEPSQRLPYLGNLSLLEAEQARLQHHIAMLKGEKEQPNDGDDDSSTVGLTPIS